MAVTSIPILVRANADIKVPVDSKLQLRRNTGTPIYIYLDISRCT